MLSVIVCLCLHFYQFLLFRSIILLYHSHYIYELNFRFIGKLKFIHSSKKKKKGTFTSSFFNYSMKDGTVTNLTTVHSI